MKFKRILAGVLSALTLTSAFAFTASADETENATPVEPYRALNAKDGVGFAGEAMTGSIAYDSKNDYVYYHFVPKDKNDWMHLGWHDADNFTWQLPMTVGFLVRTNTSATVSVRFDDRTHINDSVGTVQYTGKSANATTADGNWEVVYVEAADFTTPKNETVTSDDFNVLTHLQAFLVGENKYGNKYLESDLYVDIAGYAFFNKSASELTQADLLNAIDASGEITVTFDTQNGEASTSYEAVSGKYNDAAMYVNFPDSSKLTAPQSKRFKGWATSKDATEVLEGSVAVPDVDTTYYAIWEQDPDQPGDVTIKSLTLFGTNSDKFGVTFDDENKIYVIDVPTNWKGEIVPQIAAVATDSDATVEYDQGTFEKGSKITVKNGSSIAEYTVSYAPKDAKTLTKTPTGSVTTNYGSGKITLDGEDYTYKSKSSSVGLVTAKQEIAGTSGTKISYNTEYAQIVNGRNDEAKTVNSVAEYTIAQNGPPSLEGYGVFGVVTLSDYPWARVKYYIDPGEDNQTFARKFAIRTTASKPGNGYAISSKLNQTVKSADNMVAGRWAYAYVNLADVFAQDYGFTIQFHFRPFDEISASKVMKVSADDSTKAVPTDNAEAVLFDDSFYLASVELFNSFPEENGEYAQIAPWEGLFTATDESAVNTKDGKISGLTTDMEYALTGSDNWTKAETSEITNLEPGTYQIRYAAIENTSNGYNWSASPAVEIKVESALQAKPEVVAVNATGVGKNDGKITGVTSNMEYQLVGADSWKAVESDGELTNLAPGKYQIRYKADEIRPEASEATQVTVLVDFNTDEVFWVTGNTDYSERTNDGSSYEKPYYVANSGEMAAIVNKYLGKEAKTITMVVIDGIYLGGWNENYGTGAGKELTITGLTPDSFLDFSCHHAISSNTMQGFGNVAKLTIENITLCKTCRGINVADGKTCNGTSGECGIVIGGSTEIRISDTVIAGENANCIRIYAPASSVNNTIQIDGGKFELVHAGASFGMSSRTTGSQKIVLNGGNVSSIAATRQSQIFLGNYEVIINDGVVNTITAGSEIGAFAGDSYIEINDGAIATIRTTANGVRGLFNSIYTDEGIKNGSSVVKINGGQVNAFVTGKAAPGGSALIVSENAKVPQLTGAEADYVITVPKDADVSAVLKTEDYEYKASKNITQADDGSFTYPEDAGSVEYKASTITGFTITSDKYNTAYVGEDEYSLSNGSVTIPYGVVSKDSVNVITLANKAKITLDLNGGSSVYNGIYSKEYGEAVDFDSLGNDIKPYRSGYDFLGWTTTRQNDYAPKADVSKIEYAASVESIETDITVYAVWQQSESPFIADSADLKELQYIKYTKYPELQHPDIAPDSKLTALGPVTPHGCFRADVIDAKTGNVVKTLKMSGIKFNYFNNDQEADLAALEIYDNKIAVQDYNGWYQFFQIAPQSEYILKGTYYAKRGEYVVDLYYKGVAVNAGSFGMLYGYMDYVSITPSENVTFFTDENQIHDETHNIVFTWNANTEKSTAIGGESAGEVLVATATFKMTAEQREKCLDKNILAKVYSLPEERANEEVYSDPYYLVVSDNKEDKYNVQYHPAYCGDIIDEIGNEAMVNVTGTVVMSARNDGTATISANNYAKVYWKHKGASTWNKVEIEDANTTAKEVNFTLQNVPANVEIEIKVVKNGYITKTITNLNFNEAEDGEADVPARALEESIVLVPGDIKGSYNDECGDGIINIADFVRVIRGFDTDAQLDEQFIAAVDINEDGVITVADLSFVKSNFGAKAE